VLESFYEHPRAGIAAALGALISSPGVQISEAAIHLDALDRYRRTKGSFRGLLTCRSGRAEDTPVATFDQDFRKFSDVRIENP